MGIVPETVTRVLQLHLELANVGRSKLALSTSQDFLEPLSLGQYPNERGG